MVLTGAGDAFSAGGDVKAMADRDLQAARRCRSTWRSTGSV